MGRQVRFYMLPADEEEFLEFALSDGDVVLIDRRSTKLGPKHIGVKRILAQQTWKVAHVFLWKTSLPMAPNDIYKLRLHEYNPKAND